MNNLSSRSELTALAKSMYLNQAPRKASKSDRTEQTQPWLSLKKKSRTADNIKVNVKDKPREIVIAKPPIFKNVPRSVDILLKKQEQIFREIEMLD
jgi:hypothetical protein